MTQNTSSGVHRRTVVAGAAWTIPVVATAVGAPLAAASNTPTLAFTNGPYSVAACGTLKDVILKSTTDGATPVAAGTLVTVTLPTGLTWSDGTTGTRALPTDANGEVVLSGVKAVGNPGSRTLTASTSGATASAPVTVQPSGVATARNNSGALVTYPNVPLDATPIGAEYFLTADGHVYLGDQLIAADVTAATGYQNVGANVFTLNYVQNGVVKARDSSGATVSYPNVPADSKPLGADYFLNPDGTLYFGNQAAASGVSEAIGYYHGNANVFTVNYIENGVAKARDSSGATVTYANVPAGSTPIGAEYFLAPNGDVYLGDQIVASNVTSAVGYQNIGANVFTLNYIQGGVVKARDSSGATVSYPSVPSDSKLLRAEYFLAPNGDLYLGGQLVASDVPEAIGYYHGNANVFTVNYIQGSAC